MIIDGAQISQNIYETLREEIAAGKTTPKLCALLVGDNAASLKYIAQKKKWADYIGMDFELIQLPKDISQEELSARIDILNGDSHVDGYIVQLPLPKNIDTNSIISNIAPEKDVDGFHPNNQGKIVIGDTTALSPCTPAGIMEIFSSENISLSGKTVCVLGRSNIVGKPIMNLLTNAGATVIGCNSKTKNIKSFTLLADIIILAIGQPKFLTTDMVQSNSIIIDVGFTIVEGKIYGDADYHSLLAQGNPITPVPGGVGRMTVAMLLSNTLKAHKIAKK